MPTPGTGKGLPLRTRQAIAKPLGVTVEPPSKGVKPKLRSSARGLVSATEPAPDWCSVPTSPTAGVDISWEAVGCWGRVIPATKGLNRLTPEEVA
jgi:hypothetical protein